MSNKKGWYTPPLKDNFNLPACAFSLPTRVYFSLSTRAFSLQIRVFNLTTRGFELVTRGFELATRVLILRNIRLDILVFVYNNLFCCDI